ncbi:MAG: helicase-exonuclease AddAB subunit AddA [Lachnospiraceae bacterium]|nr:helicase-exonuclease AddAB subunit AddA [Lachnospiraceae bacterium]
MTKWTDEQQKVIDTREQNMLVSAAAGSGKTAVLVERIVQKILDNNHPVDIDKILVVTFTRAAAAEMRQRVLDAINDALELDPTNPHLLRQATLVHTAFITTIDSFCSYVVRNHFYDIDLEPGYRIGDQGEIKLMAKAAMDAVMEEQYDIAKGEDNSLFLKLIDAYGRENSDEPVTEMIQTLFEKSQSFPWPDEWLEGLLLPYQVTEISDLLESSWFTWMINIVRGVVQEALEDTRQLLQLCRMPQGPDCYAKGLEQDIVMYEDLLAYQEKRRFYEAVRECKYAPIGRKPSNYDKDMELLERVKNRRDEVKKCVEKCRQDFCAKSLEDVVSQMQLQRPMVEELIRLTRRYAETFGAYKTRKNVFDFADVEHFALDILKDKTTHECKPAALEFQRQFNEVMIDEYQDSNFIQEEILTAVTREKNGEHNLFMVGDVKQSIYRFRQACPSLFVDKYQRYTQGEEGCIAIDLQKNFRSRSQVLTFANDVFYQLMHKDLGDVEYNEDAALYCGATNYIPQEHMFDGEILVGDLTDVADKVAYEAKLIADKINDMCRYQLVTDKVTGTLRQMRYSDVVILMRSPGTWADTFIDVLQENGIPAFAESKTGYFTTREVETVLNLLRTLDNPYQDIPLAAVLHSEIFDFSNEELAEISQKGKPLMTALLEYAQAHPKDAKVAFFLEFLTAKREMIQDIPIHQLLESLLEETGYLAYVTAMPRGEMRRANLQKLIDQAVAYESTSYKGLFHFVNYIEKLGKYSVEMGEAAIVGENDDAVALMSIHKSKGLEFPVVIVAGLGKQFNHADSRGAMLLHSDMGVALELRDMTSQISDTPLYKKAVAKANKWEMYGEEMRVLYVAMTRAKEKMILVGTIAKAEETLAKWQESVGDLSLGVRENATSFMEWIVRATAGKRDTYPITLVTPPQVVVAEVAHQIEGQQIKERLLHPIVSREMVDAISRQMSYVYPYQKKVEYKNKYSVSEIKHQRMEEAFEPGVDNKPYFLETSYEPIIPQFVSKRENCGMNPGALRGTAMHRFLECYDFGGKESLQEQLERMCAKGFLSAENRELLSLDKLERFLATPLADRMAGAARQGELYKEKPFVMSVTPNELFPEADQGKDTLLVQGIIDVFFVEDGEIVLLDYKTDKVTQPKELIDRYQVQLQLYGKALARTLSLPVKEILIYSFALEETIAL